MMRTTILFVATGALMALAACTEKPQVTGQNKPASKAWDAPKTAFVDPGWKAGDEASWEEQLRKRTQGQNEYARGAPMQ